MTRSLKHLFVRIDRYDENLQQSNASPYTHTRPRKMRQKESGEEKWSSGSYQGLENAVGGRKRESLVKRQRELQQLQQANESA